MKTIKKAQTGVKATKDSTAYFKKSADINAKQAILAAKFGDRDMSEKSMKDSYKDTKSMLRQTRKGQPGYDANGYPLKKKKAKSGASIAKAKDGGKWMQKVSKSIEKRGTKGKCTPITKPGCTGRAKALAKTFKKIAKSNKKK